MARAVPFNAQDYLCSNIQGSAQGNVGYWGVEKESSTVIENALNLVLTFQLWNITFYSFIYYCLSNLVILRGCSWFCTQELLLLVIRVLSGMLGTKPWSVARKSSCLPLYFLCLIFKSKSSVVKFGTVSIVNFHHLWKKALPF